MSHKPTTGRNKPGYIKTASSEVSGCLDRPSVRFCYLANFWKAWLLAGSTKHELSMQPRSIEVLTPELHKFQEGGGGGLDNCFCVITSNSYSGANLQFENMSASCKH